ncbi:c-type cytochrome [Puniceicoccaceae bacterium K14]|nr:c-type cytochrome [Puniceicoccaceae bacterium K14]
MLRTSNESIDAKLLALCLLAVGLMTLAACSSEPKEDVSQKSTPGTFDAMALSLTDPDHVAGREIWMNTCQTCHLRGLTGAPMIGNKEAWKPRIEKGLDTLFNHAINGFIGPTYSEMPPKGGFAELSDEEVKKAVKFMTFASK